MFVGREKELALLDKLWNNAGASLVTCRGRRRIGKSTLIEEFARRSNARFIALEGKAPAKGMTNRKQLDSFREQLQRYARGKVPKVKTWFEAFGCLDAELDDGRTVLLLDEISWMGGYDRLVREKKLTTPEEKQAYFADKPAAGMTEQDPAVIGEILRFLRG